MSSNPERRYARLLRLYPKAYRDRHGAEMLATLAEANHPAGRETAALLVGALRAHAGLARLTSPGSLWVSALRLAALLLVAHATAQAAARAGRIVFSELLMGRGLTLLSDLGHLGAAACGTLALLTLAAGRYPTGMTLTAGTFACTLWGLSWYPSISITLVDGAFWQLPLAFLLTVPLLRRRPPTSARPVAWLLAVPIALLVLPTAFDASLRWQPYPLLALGVIALLWAMIDARVAIAASALFAVQALTLLDYYAPGWADGRTETLPSLVTYAASAVILAATGATLTRRQARL